MEEGTEVWRLHPMVQHEVLADGGRSILLWAMKRSIPYGAMCKRLLGCRILTREQPCLRCISVHLTARIESNSENFVESIE